MGFSEMFVGSKSSPVEKQLETLTVPMFQMMGQSLTEARESFANLLHEVKEEARNEGTEHLPENHGDILLQKEASDERIKVALAWRRKEGVTDSDIRNWWNQPDLAR